jgi:hypothetical protein
MFTLRNLPHWLIGVLLVIVATLSYNWVKQKQTVQHYSERNSKLQFEKKRLAMAIDRQKITEKELYDEIGELNATNQFLQHQLELHQQANQHDEPNQEPEKTIVSAPDHTAASIENHNCQIFYDEEIEANPQNSLALVGELQKIKVARNQYVNKLYEKMASEVNPETLLSLAEQTRAIENNTTIFTTDTTEQLLQAGLKLPAAEQVRLLEALEDSITTQQLIVLKPYLDSYDSEVNGQAFLLLDRLNVNEETLPYYNAAITSSQTEWVIRSANKELQAYYNRYPQ